MRAPSPAVLRGRFATVPPGSDPWGFRGPSSTTTGPSKSTTERSASIPPASDRRSRGSSTTRDSRGEQMLRDVHGVQSGAYPQVVGAGEQDQRIVAAGNLAEPSGQRDRK